MKAERSPSPQSGLHHAGTAGTAPGQLPIDDVNVLLESLRNGPASRDPAAAIEPLTMLFSHMMVRLIEHVIEHEVLNTSLQAKLPNSTPHHLPAGNVGENQPPLRRHPRQHEAEPSLSVPGFAGPSGCTTASSPPAAPVQTTPLGVPPTQRIPDERTTSTTDPDSLAFHAANELLDVKMLMERMAKTFNEDSAATEISRTMQGNERYLRTAAERLATSLRSTPNDAPEYREQQSNFGLTLLHLYELTQEAPLLDAALGATTLAIATLEAYNFPPTATLLVRNWVFSQRLLSRRDQNLEEIERALEVGNMVLSESSGRYPDDINGRRLLCAELAECLLDKYRATGQVDYLEDSFELMQPASLDEDLDDTQCLCILAELHLKRFMRFGYVDDCDKALRFAIQMQHFEHDASSLGPPSPANPVHPDAPRALHVLAMAWAARFPIAVDIDELDRAVACARASVRICSPKNPLYPIYLSDLAYLLYQRFIADQDISDLEGAVNRLQAIAHGKSTSTCTYVHYPPRAIFGLALAQYGSRTGDVHKIEEGAHLLALARRDFTGGAHLEARIEHDLATALFLGYKHLSALETLDEAIRHATSALDRTSPGERARWPLALDRARMYIARHAARNSQPDFFLAVEAFYAVATSAREPALRLEAAVEYAKASSSHGPAATLEALKIALDVLPLVAYAGERVSHRYRTLAQLAASVPPWAAACAIACGRPEDAVEYLERGRNAVWSQGLKPHPGARKRSESMMSTSVLHHLTHIIQDALARS